VEVEVEAEALAPLRMEPAGCCLCGHRDADVVAEGEDFEYRTSPDRFRLVRCSTCGLHYLDPRPAATETDRIYPDSYHAFGFDDERFGLVYRVRRRLEAARVLRAGAGLPADAAVLDVGCGDGFHLDVLREHGPAGWVLRGVDTDARAVAAARGRGLDVEQATLAQSTVQAASQDLVLLIQTLEHVADPLALLRSIRSVLRPGGRLLVVTDNTGSPDAALARAGYWGGYHFPRHWYLFDRATLALAADRAGLSVMTLATMTSPVNWTYSLRNALADRGAPPALVRQFGLERPLPLAAFTVLDRAAVALGRGALLRAVLTRPAP